MIGNGDKDDGEKIVPRKLAGEDTGSNFHFHGMSNPIRRQNKPLDVDCLVPFADHPFKTYEGTRFNDMVESIEAIGVVSSIIVRPADDGKYEILSGHNRVKAAIAANLQSVPAIILNGLTDDEAKLIVTETNLHQRSFSDMSHSERAAVLSMHYDAMKKQSGYRSDLIEEIEELTCSPVENRSRTMNKLGEQQGLSKETIWRYLRIGKLISTLQDRLDNNGIAVRTAVSLSSLSADEQELVCQLIQSDTKISMKQAEALKEESDKGGLSREAIERILAKTSAKVKPIELNWKLFPNHFSEEDSAEEIKSVIAKALELYFSKK